MAKHRTHSVEFKRQVSQEYLAGETLHGLSKRHDISRQLIRVWVEKYLLEARVLNAADLEQSIEASGSSPALFGDDFLAGHAASKP